MYFLTLCVHVSVAHAGRRWFGVALLLAVCSVLSKEQGITVVAVCFTLDMFLAQKVSVCVYVCTHTFSITTALSLYLQLDLWTVLATLLSTTPGKQSLPKWLRPLLVRGTLLAGFTVAIMFMRVKIMKAELPVFTE